MANKDKRQKFSLGKFLLNKLMLIAALICEVIAYLMDQGLMTGSERVISGLTVAGVVIAFIYLVLDGLRRKYKRYSEQWGFSSSGGAEKDDRTESVPQEKSGV